MAGGGRVPATSARETRVAEEALAVAKQEFGALNGKQPIARSSRGGPIVQTAVYVLAAGVLAEMLVSAVFSRRLGDKVATRFGLDGKPYGFMPKGVALGMGPVASVIVGIIILLPGGRNLGRGHLWISMTILQALLAGVMAWLFQRNLSAGSK